MSFISYVACFVRFKVDRYTFTEREANRPRNLFSFLWQKSLLISSRGRRLSHSGSEARKWTPCWQRRTRSWQRKRPILFTCRRRWQEISPSHLHHNRSDNSQECGGNDIVTVFCLLPILSQPSSFSFILFQHKIQKCAFSLPALFVVALSIHLLRLNI